MTESEGFDLIAFLRARLDEDERVAQDATPGPWEFEGDDPTDDEVYTVHDGEHGDLCGNTVAFARNGGCNGRQQPNTAHMARHDPARVLAEVDAKRRIIELHQPREHPRPKIDLQYCITCMDAKSGYQEDWKEEVWPCATLRLLALPYSDHPEYRPEWRL